MMDAPADDNSSYENTVNIAQAEITGRLTPYFFKNPMTLIYAQDDTVTGA